MSQEDSYEQLRASFPFSHFLVFFSDVCSLMSVLEHHPGDLVDLTAIVNLLAPFLQVLGDDGALKYVNVIFVAEVIPTK